MELQSAVSVHQLLCPDPLLPTRELSVWRTQAGVPPEDPRLQCLSLPPPTPERFSRERLPTPRAAHSLVRGRGWAPTGGRLSEHISWGGSSLCRWEREGSWTLSVTIHSVKFAGPFCGQEKG